MFDFLVKWKIDSAFKNNKRKHAFRNMGSMENILILFSYSDWPEIEPIAKDLAANGKNIAMWSVQPPRKARNNVIFPSSVRIVHHKERSLFQIVSSSVLNEFKSEKYDTLIDLTTTHNTVFGYLLANNTSECCIGISRAELPVYDFAVLREDKMSLPETYRQIKIYLNNVR
jgi:hypothetical protein